MTDGPGASVTVTGFESGANGTGQRLRLATGILGHFTTQGVPSVGGIIIRVTFTVFKFESRSSPGAASGPLTCRDCRGTALINGHSQSLHYSEDWFLKPPGRAQVAVTTLAWFSARKYNFCKAPKVAF